MAFDPVSGLSVASVSVLDQEKFLHATLLERAHLKLITNSVCEKIKQPKGTGLTANFVRYKRMNVPMATLTEGVAPSNSSYSLEAVTVTLDQWGDVISISDIARLTTKHNLWSEVMDLLLDNAERVIDRETQIVLSAGTNVFYGDGSVTTRQTVTAAMVMSQTILHKLRITMTNNGAPARFGPSNMQEMAKGKAAKGNMLGGAHYLFITTEEVVSDIMSIAAPAGLWQAVSQYQNAKAVYNGEVGDFLGFRFVTTNFIPIIEQLGDTTVVVASTAGASITGLVVTAVDGGGALNSAVAYCWKLVRKDLLRGFAEDVTIGHTTTSTATGNNESFTFALPSTAGFVYDLYFDGTQTGGTSTNDANLKLHTANKAAGTTITVTAIATSTTTAPASVNTTGTPDIHFGYILGAKAAAWVGLQELETFVTGDKAEKSDPLNQVKTMGYKFMGKAVILNQFCLLRWEGATAYGSNTALS